MSNPLTLDPQDTSENVPQNEAALSGKVCLNKDQVLLEDMRNALQRLDVWPRSLDRCSSLNRLKEAIMWFESSLM